MFIHFILDAVLVGLGATAFMDLAAEFQRRALGTAAAPYRLVGRWLLGMGRGRFAHLDIGRSPPRRLERPLGWAAHYGVGIGFVAAMLAAVGPGWIAAPTPGPALVTGLVSVAAPLLVMQPAFGYGIAAAGTPRPWAARWRSLRAHLTFGAGIYLAAMVLRALR